MSDDSMTDLFVMAGDWGNLDSQGLEEFRKSFSKKLSPPTDIYRAGEKAITKVFGIALTSLSIVFFLILIVLIICITLARWINVETAILIILFIIFIFWLGYLLFKSAMKNELDKITLDINTKIGNYGENLFEELLSAIKIGASSYNKIKKLKNSEINEEDNLGPPLD